MKVILQFSGLVALLLGSMGVLAGKYDGSSPLLCAMTQTVGCDGAADCGEGPASAFNLPIFVKFDAQKKEVITAREGDKRRTSKISEVKKADEFLAFVGFEPDGGWSATIDTKSGNITGTVALNGNAYIILGSCLVP